MSGAPIEFYFDFSSPYGYLGAQRIDTIAAEFGRNVSWRPILLGVIFKATNQSPLVSQPLRGPYSAHDMARSARKLGVKFALPDGFPFSSVYTCRVFYWLDSHSPDAAKTYARAVYHAAFADGRVAADPEGAADLAVGLGHDRAATLAGMQEPAIKECLRAEVQQAMDKGVFGSPFVIVDGEPFWGNDRLTEVREWLQTGGW
ncbi:MAG TPA: 2-hydroxychromene-2-carboxylate isomerase [Dongiaceae bacterium]|jgi:2-hydroxychromene-2-carboxylate isomerase|nr:2-hydroxychromene-2-carboxylate isomerase [Dongiaceae bacterium]